MSYLSPFNFKTSDGSGLVVEHVFSKHEALGSDLNTETPGKVS